MLPKSCKIPDISLLNAGNHPFASGALADMYEGFLDGSRVCVEKIRMYSEENSQRVKMVGHPHCSFSRSHLHLACPDVLQKGSHSEALEAQKHRPFYWRNPQSSSTRFCLDARWESGGVRHGTSGEKSAPSRGFPHYCAK